MIKFQAWPKIHRLLRDITITEKIDGTNAAVVITEAGHFAAQSRTRFIAPDDDNYGFARWAYDHQADLTRILGPGTHFGEWWGSGIQRRYDKPAGVRMFSLFNTSRWRWTDEQAWQFQAVPGLSVVPTLYEGDASWRAVTDALDSLRTYGSYAAPGYMNPEGIVVYHHAARTMFKVGLDGDAVPKTVAALQATALKARPLRSLALAA